MFAEIELQVTDEIIVRYLSKYEIGVKLVSLIKCTDVNLSYDGLKVAKDITFKINSGDYYSIIGRNGSGKSTLLKALLKLKQPESGKIEYGDGLCQADIGYLAQQTPVQKDFPASVNEVVLSGCLKSDRFKAFYNKSDKQRAEEKMTLLGITDIRNKCFRELSGGQQQRVMLARAMCAANRILFLDEPVTGLDPVVTTEFFNIINQMHQSGVTIVMVSHDIHCAVKYSNRILHMDGKIAFDGTAHDYVHSEVGKEFVGGHRHD